MAKNITTITEEDILKANAIIKRINKIEKAGKDYVYTIGINKDFNFILNIVNNVEPSTVLLVTTDNDKEPTIGIIYFGSFLEPLIYGTFDGEMLSRPHLLSSLDDNSKSKNWCIGEIRTATIENAKTLSTESLFQNLLLNHYNM